MKSYAQRMKKTQIANLQQSPAVGAQIGNQAMSALMGYDESKSKSDPALEDKMRAKLQKRFSFPNQEAHREPGGVPLPPAIQNEYEEKSGVPLDDVRVHYASDKPAELDADAFAYGSDIYLAPKEEQHLQHELTHVIQQKCGIVSTTRMDGALPINDNEALERIASSKQSCVCLRKKQNKQHNRPVIQRVGREKPNRRRLGRNHHGFVGHNFRASERLHSANSGRSFCHQKRRKSRQGIASGIDSKLRLAKANVRSRFLRPSCLSDKTRKRVHSVQQDLPNTMMRERFYREPMDSSTWVKKTVDELFYEVVLKPIAWQCAFTEAAAQIHDAHSKTELTESYRANAIKQSLEKRKLLAPMLDEQASYLMLGEGNFSFSDSFLKKHIGEVTASNIYSCSFGSFPEADSKKEELRKAGVNILEQVDATKLDQFYTKHRVNPVKFDHVYFNYPRVSMGSTKELISQYAETAKNVTNEGSFLHIAVPTHRTWLGKCKRGTNETHDDSSARTVKHNKYGNSIKRKIEEKGWLFIEQKDDPLITYKDFGYQHRMNDTSKAHPSLEGNGKMLVFVRCPNHKGTEVTKDGIIRKYELGELRKQKK